MKLTAVIFIGLICISSLAIYLFPARAEYTPKSRGQGPKIEKIYGNERYITDIVVYGIGPLHGTGAEGVHYSCYVVRVGSNVAMACPYYL